MKKILPFILVGGLISYNQGRSISTQMLKRIGSKRCKRFIQKLLQTSYTRNWEVVRQEIMAEVKENSHAINVEQYDCGGHTALTKAIEKDDISLARFLLNNGADPNTTLREIHSSKPIFFARSLEMAHLLQKYGADITLTNQGTGWSKKKNLLHSTINCNITDIRLFNFYLKQGLNPEECTHEGQNLWHSLIKNSVYRCPEEWFLKRAQKLHSLKINPYQKDNAGISAVDELKKIIEEESAFLDRVDSGEETTSKVDIDERRKILNKLKLFLEIMEEGNDQSCVSEL